MATNVHRSESRIYFSDEPSIYYGWYASGSAWSVESTMFNTIEARDAYIKEVGERIEFDTYHWNAEGVAAMFALHECAGENYGDEAITREIIMEDIIDEDEDAWATLGEIFAKHHL